jgi:hypothetical protein
MMARAGTPEEGQVLGVIGLIFGVTGAWLALFLVLDWVF